MDEQTDNGAKNNMSSQFMGGDIIIKLLTGHDFAARSCCDLDLQGIDPNVNRDISFQYGDHFCIIVVKSNFK